MFLAFLSQHTALTTYQHWALKDASAWDRPSSWKQGYPCFWGTNITPASVKHIHVGVAPFVDLCQAHFHYWIIFLSRCLLWFMNIRVHSFFFLARVPGEKVFFTPASPLPQSHGVSHPQTRTHRELSLAPRGFHLKEPAQHGAFQTCALYAPWHGPFIIWKGI